jgi:hypothetical protein
LINESDKSKTNSCLPFSGSDLGLGTISRTCSDLDQYVIDIRETAEFLDIPLVSSLCQEWLEVRMITDNVVGIWRIAISAVGGGGVGGTHGLSGGRQQGNGGWRR